MNFFDNVYSKKKKPVVFVVLKWIYKYNIINPWIMVVYIKYKL